MEYRKIIIIGVAPGELAGDLTRGYEAAVTFPAMRPDGLTGALIPDARGGVSAMLDEHGEPVTTRRFGARPAGEFGPGDPGDPGIPTLRFRVAFWLRAPPGQFKPLPRLDRYGNESAGWLVPSQVPTEGTGALTLEEVAALRAGELIERVVDDAGGQVPESTPITDLEERLIAEWDRMQAALVSPPIHGVPQFAGHGLLMHSR